MSHVFNKRIVLFIVYFTDRTISSGFSLEDPNVFVGRLQHILEAGLSVDSSDEPEETTVNETTVNESNVIEPNSSTMEQVD